MNRGTSNESTTAASLILQTINTNMRTDVEPSIARGRHVAGYLCFRIRILYVKFRLNAIKESLSVVGISFRRFGKFAGVSSEIFAKSTPTYYYSTPLCISQPILTVTLIAVAEMSRRLDPLEQNMQASNAGR
jgi:hypothetical protein